MADKIICDMTDLVAIADAVREKTGGTKKYSISQLREYLVKEITTPTISLPELINPASETEIFKGYDVIDADGEKKIGTFTIEQEIVDQNALITELVSTLRVKILEAAGQIVSDYNSDTSTLTLTLSNASVSTSDDTVVVTE